MSIPQARLAGLIPSKSDLVMPVFRLRRVFNGTMTRGWQVLRDDSPISGLFDQHDDAMAALDEFRAEAAIAMEAAKPLRP